jgi:hypothetical protein
VVRLSLFILTVGLLLSGSFLTAQDKTTSKLSEARAAVKKNMQSAAWCQYDAIINGEFPEKYEASMQRCTKSAIEKDLENFEIFMQIARDGSIQRILLSPETKVALCLRRDILKGKFAAPPSAGYWMRIEMQITD